MQKLFNRSYWKESKFANCIFRDLLCYLQTQEAPFERTLDLLNNINQTHQISNKLYGLFTVSLLQAFFYTHIWILLLIEKIVEKIQQITTF